VVPQPSSEALLYLTEQITFSYWHRVKGSTPWPLIGRASLLSSVSKVGIQVDASSFKFQRLLLPVGSLALSLSLAATLVARHQDAQHPAPDNTNLNGDQTGPTADQEKMNPSDRAITQKIRKAIHHDKSLSTYGRNIKIFTQEGKVTLRGPVRSEEEKRKVEAKAVSVAGQENVSDQLEVAPSK
jgi:hyperosmotically inducible protein